MFNLKETILIYPEEGLRHTYIIPSRTKSKLRRKLPSSTTIGSIRRQIINAFTNEFEEMK